MHLPPKTSRRVLAVALALAVAIPVIAQDKPESILPPGFGDQIDEPDAPPASKQPADIVPKLDIDLPDEDADSDEPRSGGSGSSSPRRSSGSGARPATDLGSVLAESDSSDEDGDGEEDGEGVRVGRRDLPPEAQRSTAVVGIINADGGDLGIDGFYGLKGQFLTNSMRKTSAPIASRWASVLLRRALLSQTATPSDVDGADWVAERAWLLLRMGEADAARMLVQAVDTDNYTPKMLQVAMQAALATSDPSGMCPIAEKGEEIFKEGSWPLARAMCHGLSGESAQANAMIDRVRDRKQGRGIDVLLAEKVVGAGANTRRAVMIQWENVNQLTAWRYGLASATGVAIPPQLLNTAGPQVSAWMARSPLMTIDQRIVPAERAAAMGVLSASALADIYGAWFDATDPAERSGKAFEPLRRAFIAPTAAERLGAMKSLWDDPNVSGNGRYARLLLTSQAAARIAPAKELAPDSERIIASMLSAGLDKPASRWAETVSSSNELAPGWALLAVGAPQNVVEVTPGRIGTYKNASGEKGARRAQLLFAGLAGLGRLSTDDINDLAETYEVPVGRKTRWNQALDLAVQRNAKAAVALIAAAGLQTQNWDKVPAVHLYHIVSALRRVGLEAEARMIAAEALMRT